MPWLAQGTTTRAADGSPLDMGFFGATASADIAARWLALREASGCPRAVHSRQVHGATMDVHDSDAAGVFIGEGCDGHITKRPGVLLTVSVADCVPVFMVDPDRRALALVHAGWRGGAAGALEEGVAGLTGAGCRVGDLLVHLGPSICGACYEVGPEVFSALGLEPPIRPEPLDLRAALAARAVAVGVAAERITASAHCTRCDRAGPRRFHSHRAGDPERQIAFLGVRA